ncbi:hypothetical protein [Acidiphilium sp.]|uniref:hypothetical protein n=1 Tax=Acidiphilium sp. TaxID=527 RepID=UPI003D01A067
MNSQTSTDPTTSLRIDLLGDPALDRPLSTTTMAPAVPLPDEFVALFLTIETLRTSPHGFVIQFVATQKGAGTSTIAAGFAHAAAQAYRRPVLLITATAPFGAIDPLPTDTASLFHAPIEPPLAGLADTLTPALDDRLAELRRQYHAVVIDCPALGEAPHAIAMARHCDGTALIAAAARTSARDMIAARDTITRVGGQVLGAIFNRERSYRPAWLGGRG